MEVVNPATETTHSVQETALSELPEIVRKAKMAQKEWAKHSISERASIIQALGPLMNDSLEMLAQSITNDMGKPIAKARAEVEGVIRTINFYCSQAADWLASEKSDLGEVVFDPLGVVAVISPWNFPIHVPSSGIFPALLAGNAVVFKPSEYTLETGKGIAALFRELPGLPENIFQIVVGGKEHGKALVEQAVDMVHFTGSTAAGKHIMQSCAAGLKRVLLELGGMDAAIVLKDADVKRAAQKIVGFNCNNTGQVCCSIKRVYVEEEIYDEFVRAATAVSSGITFGDPNTNVDMGPLVAGFQRDKVASIVKDAKNKGAKIHTGGELPTGKGYFYPSTIITDVSKEMRLLNEEPFGPVLPIMKVSSWQEAVEEANSSMYGLTGSVWSNDLELGKKVAALLEVGTASVNKHGPGPLGTPFGGAKQSGIGRVKTKEAMRDFCNTKFIQVDNL